MLHGHGNLRAGTLREQTSRRLEQEPVDDGWRSKDGRGDRFSCATFGIVSGLKHLSIRGAAMTPGKREARRAVVVEGTTSRMTGPSPLTRQQWLDDDP